MPSFATDALFLNNPALTVTFQILPSNALCGMGCLSPCPSRTVNALVRRVVVFMQSTHNNCWMLGSLPVFECKHPGRLVKWMQNFSAWKRKAAFANKSNSCSGWKFVWRWWLITGSCWSRTSYKLVLCNGRSGQSFSLLELHINACGFLSTTGAAIART